MDARTPGDSTRAEDVCEEFKKKLPTAKSYQEPRTTQCHPRPKPIDPRTPEFITRAFETSLKEALEKHEAPREASEDDNKAYVHTRRKNRRVHSS